MMPRMPFNLSSRLNILLVIMIFIGISTYDRNIELSQYSTLQYGMFLVSKFSGYILASFLFNYLSQRMSILKLFILAVVLFCEGGILFWVFESFITKIITYSILGFGFSMINLTTSNFLRGMNAHRFRISILGIASATSMFLTTLPHQKQMLLTLFVCIGSIIPYIFRNHNDKPVERIGNESRLNLTVFDICFRYYGKAFWSIIFAYISDGLFTIFFVKRLRLIYDTDQKSILMNFYVVILIRISLHYPVQMLLAKLSPERKITIIAATTCIMSAIQLLFYENKYLNLFTNAGIALFGSFFPFANEYLDKHRSTRHSFVPINLIVNILYGIVLLIVVPLGVYISAVSPHIGVNYIILFVNIATIINMLI